MYQLTRLEFIETKHIFDGSDENILIELYIDYRTNKKYILNKIGWQDFAYVKEYHSNILTEKNMFIMPDGEDDEEIYGKNLLSIGSWRIESGCYREDYLTEIDIC